ncbi:MAG: tRNA (adenosine(37)-N6)-threonylcarbamoyltransferase complex dimerization subunit type 1 TsaB [Desulfovibrio sp.]|jgi:tRNA threonylcarbamoyl adenosine modification protein YeaZ|nr:tRNA (adenosine(37)-N6)-threonylcarbamoyltransferase complex dimerization subunit type 1 TsaB [Desulfovibrio sp.]
MTAVLSTGPELILNASEGVLQIIVTENEKPLCVQEWHRPERATEILVPALREICASLNVRLPDFRRIACVRGPGSFTGIRLVLTTAAALRRAGRAQLAGLDYLQALACSAVIRRGLLYGIPLWAVTHAKRDLVHCRPFVAMGPVIPPAPARDAELCSPKEALRRMVEESETLRAPSGTRTETKAVCVCGSALARHASVFSVLEDIAEKFHSMPELVCPDSAALRLLARHGDYFPQDIEPLYIRPSDAAENLPGLAARQGMDADAAAAELERLLRANPASDV